MLILFFDDLTSFSVIIVPVALVLTGVEDGEKVGASMKVEFTVEINSTFLSLLVFFTKFVFTLNIPKNSMKVHE